MWADVKVSSVIDGGLFWAQVGGGIVDDKPTTVRRILQQQASSLV